jgi:hypothetical protein
VPASQPIEQVTVSQNREETLVRPVLAFDDILAPREGFAVIQKPYNLHSLSKAIGDLDIPREQVA